MRTSPDIISCINASIWIVAVSSVLFACADSKEASSDCITGTEDCTCLDNGECSEDFTCDTASNTCVSAESSVGDDAHGNSDADTDSDSDADTESDDERDDHESDEESDNAGKSAERGSDEEEESDDESDEESDVESDDDGDTERENQEDSDTGAEGDSDTDSDTGADDSLDTNSDLDSDQPCQHECMLGCVNSGGIIVDGTCEIDGHRCCDLGDTEEGNGTGEDTQADTATGSDDDTVASDNTDLDRPAYAYAATVENTGADCDVGALDEPGQLPQISSFPDPFVMLSGTSMSKKSEWRCRRQEIHEQAEKYIYGEKPIPDAVSGTVSQNRVTVNVEAEGKQIEFSADIVLPSSGQGPFPAIINVGKKGMGGFGGISLGEDRVLQEGVAVIYYDHYGIGTEGTPEQSRGEANPGLFYDIYGGMHSAGLLMAWAWGASRLIDVLQESGGDIIDYRRLGVTGCSRNGKGAFAIGVFDERIALTIPHETSTAGVPSYRIVDILGQERTDHNYYGLNWLSNNFEPFVYDNGTSNAVKLPIDSHALVAMVAPRGLLVLENPHERQMGAPAGHAATMGGLEVYKALGREENVSYHSDVPDTGHCAYKNEYTDLLVQNIAKFLKHEIDEPGRIEVGQDGSLNLAEWIDWDTPVLENDTTMYETD